MPEEHHTLDIGFVLDSRYLEPTSVSCLSVMLHADRTVIFHVASRSGVLRLLPGVEQYAAAEGHEIRYISVDPPLRDSPLPKLSFHKHVSDTSWLMFGLFDAAETDSGRLLYLDGDTLVLTALDPAALAPAPPTVIAARVDPWNPTVDSPKGVQVWSDLGIPRDRVNVNSGVVCVNLLRWRSDALSDAVADALMSYGSRMLLGDQEALNVALTGNVTLLSPEYNAMVIWDRSANDSQRRTARLSPENKQVIRHFAGWRKPWLSLWKNQPHGDEWHRLRRMIAERRMR